MAATQDDLDGIGLKAEREWRLHRPELVKALEREGTLYEVLVQLQENVEALYQRLRNQGVQSLEAISLAEREYVSLPDVKQPKRPPALTTG